MIWKDIATISLSSIAVLISAFTLFKNRKNLTVDICKNLEVITDGQIELINPTEEINSYGAGFLYQVQVVNPSPNDIAYFDIRAFSPDNNQNTYLLTRKSLAPSVKDAKVFKREGSEIFELEIPDKNHGIFKANSYTYLDIFILPQEHIKNNIIVSFKIAKSAILRDAFAVTKRKRYKFYSTKFDLSDPVLPEVPIEQD
ncbi:hypothetical protein GWY05_06870 [Listeria monocytogenes]|nr:hypothetical protein [Listeria monocytogenes]